MAGGQTRGKPASGRAARSARLDARAVVQQADRRLPPFWRMYRWSRRRDAARLGISILILGVLILFALLAEAAARNTGTLDANPFSASGQSSAGVSAVTAAVLEVCALSAGVAALVPLVVAVGAVVSLLLPDSRRPMLVVTPEGCAERTGALLHRFRAVPFAEISHIELRVSKIRMTVNRHTRGLPVVTTHSAIRLILHDWNGQQHAWALRGGFGQPATLAQVIIAAHGEYTNTVSARRPRVRPTDTNER